jgi:flagellar motor switch protein FliN/FliY
MADEQREILEQLGSQFSLALEGMLGEQWPASIEADAALADTARHLCWNQKLNIHKNPLIMVSADADVWREIGTRALAAVGLEEAEESDVRATYLELLTQALSGLARFLTGKAGQEVTLESGSETTIPASSGGEKTQCVRLTSPSGFSADLFVKLDKALLSSLAKPTPAVEETVAAASATAAEAPRAVAAVAAAGPGTVGSAPPMDMLLDVELPVSVSFGRTHLPLKDVIKLSTGSIIELNRTITEPVEVIVNNCVVARGEVVVIEGNYGVRINQIVSRTDRLRTVD